MTARPAGKKRARKITGSLLFFQTEYAKNTRAEQM
jgi:hypothetical protein